MLEVSTPVQISVVLPAYNEEAAITDVIHDIKQSLEGTGYTYEILVINDASTDNTAELAKKSGVRVISRPKRGGSGASRKKGILEASGQIIVMLDADGTYCAADIPKLLKYFPEYDQVNGARSVEQGTAPLLRRAAKWFLNRLASWLMETSIPDLNTGLKAFKRDLMRKYLWMIPNGFSCVSTMTLAFLGNGHAVTWVTTNYFKRIGRSKFHPIRDTYLYLLAIVRMVMYFNPLKVFLPLSLGLFTIGILKTLIDWFFLVRRMQASDVVILMTAVMVFVAGLLAELIVTTIKAITQRSDE